MKTNLFLATACCLLSAVIAAPALGQSDSRDRDSDYRQRDNEQSSNDDYDYDYSDYDFDDQNADARDNRRSREDRRRSRDNRMRDRQRDDRENRERSRENQSRDNRSEQQQDSQSYRLQPHGWVAVAYDYDNDGFYEGADYVYYYDLQEARDRSRQRAEDEQNRQANNRNRGSENQGNREQVRVRGELLSMQTKSMMGSDRRDDRDYKFAKLETDSGRTVRVCLGSKEKVSDLDLREGDRVTIEGVRAKVDDREVVLARKVSAGGDSITNELPRRDAWKRLSGDIRSISHTQSGERKERHTVVKVKNEQGQVKQIDLGPKNELDELDLQEGDEITVLGRQGRIDGETMIIAQLVRANGETADVREATNRSLKSRSQRSRR